MSGQFAGQHRMRTIAAILLAACLFAISASAETPAAASLEPRLAKAETRLKQLGRPPGKEAPPEAPAIAEERARLNEEFGELDATVKQTRLLAPRADQLAEQITERRRSTYAKQLFEQTPSVLSPSLWLEAAQALPDE